MDRRFELPRLEEFLEHEKSNKALHNFLDILIEEKSTSTKRKEALKSSEALGVFKEAARLLHDADLSPELRITSDDRIERINPQITLAWDFRDPEERYEDEDEGFKSWNEVSLEISPENGMFFLRGNDPYFLFEFDHRTTDYIERAVLNPKFIARSHLSILLWDDQIDILE